MTKIFSIALLTIFLLSCAAEKDYLIKIETRHGEMLAVLFDETPVHKQNFIALAERGRFDSTEFHRIIENFMIQGGDVFSKEELPPTEWPTLPSEIVPGLIHTKGMIAAARQGDKINPERRSNGSQFYIIQGKVYSKTELVTDMKMLQQNFMKFIQLESQAKLKEKYSRLYEASEYDSLNAMMLDEKENLESFYRINLEAPFTPEQVEAYTTIGGTPHLDGEYTVFGKVVSGMDVLEKIAGEETVAGDRPSQPIFIVVSVERMSKDKISKLLENE